VRALVEENARRAVQLGNDDSFRTVYDERTGRGHIRDVPEKNVLDLYLEILVILIGTLKAKFCLQRDIVGKPALKAFFDRVLGRVDEIVYKIESIAVSGVLDRKNLLKNLVQTFSLAAVRSSLQLEEVTERLQLNLQKVRVFQDF
jgi:hypothetical protein